MKTERNILVVDDDPDIGNMLKMTLEYKGYTVTLLRNAINIEQMLSSRETDLVILDMLISGLNGVDICRSIKNNPLFAHIHVLMISALPDARKICLDAGADEFIAKPFEMLDLLSKIHHQLNKQLIATSQI